MVTENLRQGTAGADSRVGALRNRLEGGVLCREVVQNRYLDVGDWVEGYVGVVPHDDVRSEAAVLVHEFVEYLLCTYAGISPEAVDRADAQILSGKLRKQRSCYWKQHLAALRAERIFCEAIGLDWNEHGRNVNKAYYEQERLLMSGMKKMKSKMGRGFAKLKPKMSKVGKKEKAAVKEK